MMKHHRSCLLQGDSFGFRFFRTGSTYSLELFQNDVVVCTLPDIPAEDDFTPCVTISNNVRLRIEPPGMHSLSPILFHDISNFSQQPFAFQLIMRLFFSSIGGSGTSQIQAQGLC
jgi:hypothetical protein